MMSSPLSSQEEWQEHFSHDRIAYMHIGQFVIDGEIVLMMGNWSHPMNTLETITGNTKKDVIVVSEANEYNIKTTTTGINEKEILMLNPFDYDFYGIGIYSLRLYNNAIHTRSIQLINDEYPNLYDAYIPGGPLDNKDCVTNSKEWLTLDANDNVIGTVPLQNKFKFHETPGELFQINGTIMNPIDLSSDHPGGLDLGSYDKLENDPYRNQIAVISNNEMRRYAIENCELIRTDQLYEYPLEVIFTEEGFYYLVETDESYIVYDYSDELGLSEVWYELQKEEEVLDFIISSFEIIGEDIYFLGLIKRPNISGHFSYVQKRNKNISFAPIRKDVSLDSIYVLGTPTGPNPWDWWNYNYWFKVTNTSEDTVHHFTVLSPSIEDDASNPQRLVNQNISVDLAPGESYEGTGEYSTYESSYLTLRIAGVDFGFDRDMSNNSYTVDIKTLSSNDPQLNVYSISPNPSSDLIFLKGELSEIKSIHISNITGRQIEIAKKGINSIDISFLPKGQYWLEVRTRSHLEQHAFIKI